MVCATMAALTLSGCGGASSDDELPTGALDQMSIAFNGSPSKTEVQASMDAALAATDMAMTERNYSRAGSVLVSFRKKYGHDEMDILECIPRRTGDPRVTTLDFPTVAAVCVADMTTGDYP